MKNLSRLTALLLALMMLFTSMPAFATESEAIPVDEFEAADYASLLTIAEEDAAATADASWGNIFDGMPCEDDNVFCQNVLHMLECPNAQKRYEYLNSLYSEDGVDLEFTMLHYYFHHIEDQENMTDSVVCTCSFPMFEPEYVPGDVSMHDESCPWHFANLSLAEQYDVIRDMDANTQATYKETLSADALDTLNRVNVSEYETGNSAANIAINVPDGAFAADYLLDVQDVGKQQAMLDAILAEMGEDAIADHVAAFDITFGNLVSGNEMQPDEAVQMMFTIPTASLPAVEGELYLHVFHMIENSDGTYAAESAASNIAINAETENQSLTVKAKAFSTYYVVAGTSDNGNNSYDTSIVELPSESSTYYVEPGTIIQFTSGTFSGTGTTGITRNNRTITIANDAQIGATASFTVNRITLTFIVANRSEIIAGAIATQPVYLSVKTDAILPSEPGVTSGDWKRVNGNYVANSWSEWNEYTFADSAENYIDSSILNGLIISVDGTSTVGVYDATGNECLKYLKNIDWDKLMDVAVNQRAKATDGTTITSNNRANYVIIPYVVKFMGENGIGWHIDCIPVPANRITLSYDLNLKNYVVTSSTLQLPNAVTSASGLINTSVGYIKKGSSNLNVNGTVSATLDGTDYTLKFLGWSTDPNASTAEYAPNANISVDKDTVLYAVWSGKAVLGTLEIRKTVIGNNAPANDEFTFTVTFSKSVTLGYTVSDLSGNVVNRGNIASGGSLKLKNGQTATIVEVPIGSYSVVESPAENYTTTSTGANGTITEDGTSTAVFTNTYVEPTVTINYVAVGGGSVNPSSETVGIYSNASGSTATAADSYTFVGWYDNASCTGTALSTAAEYTPDKVDNKNVAATYYALFEENEVTINYVVDGPAGCGTVDLNDGTANPVTSTFETVKVLSGNAVGATAAAAEDYNFVGWYDANGNRLSTDASYVPAKVGNKNVAATYYAKFAEKTVTINYVAVTTTGGSVSLPTETLAVLTGEAQGSIATANTNYKFVGWYKTEACAEADFITEDAHYTPAKVNGKNVAATYYAKFELDVSTLTISKTVVTATGSTQDANLANREFTFNVTLGDTAAHTYTVYNADNTQASTGSITGGSGTIKLKNGQRAVIDTVVINSSYSVAETDLPTGYSVENATQSGNIAAAGSSAAFTNIYTTSTLSITKTVVGSDAPVDDEFTFHVSLPDGSYKYKVNGGEEMTLSVSDGKGSLTLSHGQTAVISGIAVGANYAVEEATANDYTVTVGDPDGVMPEAGASVSFLNTYKYDSLVITKTVQTVGKTAAPTNDEFTFTVALKDADGKDLTGSYSYSGSKTGTISNGGTLTLKSGEYVQISKLPLGAQYTITETLTDAQALYYVQSSTGSTGTIADVDASIDPAAFTNTYRSGELEVTKTVVGAASVNANFTPDANQAFTFTVELKDANGNALSDVQYKIGEGSAQAFNGTLTLTNGQKATFVNLPNGATYKVVETNIPVGYVVDAAEKSGAITANQTSTAAFTNTFTVDDLTIDKTITGGDTNTTDDVFTFNATIGGTLYTGTYYVGGVAKEATNGKIQIKESEQAVIRDIPVDTTYSVSEPETEIPAGYTYSSGAVSNQKIATGDNAVVITNTYTTTTLTIAKSITDSDGNTADDVFSFNVTLPAGTYGVTGDADKYSVAGVANATELTSNGGAVAVTIIGQNSITIDKIPTNATYSVDETEVPTGYAYVSGEVTNASIGTEAKTVTITNIYYTSTLSISKVVEGTDAPDAPFEFTVELPNGTYNYTVGGETKTLTVSGGSGTLSLKNGQTAVISGIPVGADYAVDEADYSDYTTTITSGSASGSIASEGSAVTYKNAYLYDSLTIEKKVENKTDVAATTDEFEFTINLADASNAPITGSFNYSVNGTDADKPLAFTDGTATLTLKGGYVVVIKGLLIGTKYSVTETVPIGFESSTIPVTGTIADGENKVTVTNTFKVGDLKITKKLKDQNGNDIAVDDPNTSNDPFTFKVTLPAGTYTVSGTEGKYSVYVPVPDNGEDEDEGEAIAVADDGNTITVIEGYNTIVVTIKGQNTVTIGNIPINSSYTVEEADPQDGYTFPEEYRKTGTMDDDGQTVEFINTYTTGSFAITKTVVGDDAPKGENSETFEFKISTNEGVYTYSIDGGEEKTLEVKRQSGSSPYGTIYLKDGEKATISGIAMGVSYMVSEIFPTEVIEGGEEEEPEEIVYTDYTTTVNGKETRSYSSYIKASGETINFVNTYDYASLTIVKEGIEDIDHHAKDGTNEEESQSTIFNVKGNGVDMNVVINGNDSVTIKHLPVGSYTVTEDETWSWRYTPEGGVAAKNVTINPTGENKVTFNNSRDEIYWLSGDCYAENNFGAFGTATN